MNRLILSEQGNNFRLNIRVCLNWLFLGGEIKTSSGHTLIMQEDGLLGFKVTHYKNGLDSEGQQMIMMAGADTSWMYLIGHAKAMSETDRMVMAGNCALNER